MALTVCRTESPVSRSHFHRCYLASDRRYLEGAIWRTRRKPATPQNATGVVVLLHPNPRGNVPARTSWLADADEITCQALVFIDLLFARAL